MRQGQSHINRAALAALVIFGSLILAPAFGEALFKHASLKIATTNGPVHLDVEVADTEPKRERGLMFRQKLAGNQGMIFLFGDERQIAMWMKNTYIPLDMVFIGNDWRIVHIEADAEPLSTGIIHSIRPASRVLEIAGGQAKRLGLKPGDLVSLQQ
ncbi:MAG: DUF192 domain-containing protein [Rhodomicrobium sp.]|nr:DUF192 domain-containing protein [Rhodomicrobium sp.]